MEKQEDNKSKTVKTYELGYLATPLLPEDQVLELIETQVKALLAKLGAVLKQENSPKIITLAYPVRQVVEHKSTIYKEAYFGAIRFELEPEVVDSFKTELKKIAELIRTLLIVLPKDYNHKVERRIPPAKTQTLPESEGVTPEVPEAMTKEAIDKEIEGLLTPAK